MTGRLSSILQIPPAPSEVPQALGHGARAGMPPPIRSCAYIAAASVGPSRRHVLAPYNRLARIVCSAVDLGTDLRLSGMQRSVHRSYLPERHPTGQLLSVDHDRSSQPRSLDLEDLELLPLAQRREHLMSAHQLGAVDINPHQVFGAAPVVKHLLVCSSTSILDCHLTANTAGEVPRRSHLALTFPRSCRGRFGQSTSVRTRRSYQRGVTNGQSRDNNSHHYGPTSR